MPNCPDCGKPIMTLFIRPVYGGEQRVRFTLYNDPRAFNCVVRGIVNDETLFKDTYFERPLELVDYAIRMGWRDRYHIITADECHVLDRPRIPPRRKEDT